MTVVVKREDDWCFLCDRRRHKLVGISYEIKTDSDKGDTHFLRICSECVKRIQKTLDEKVPVNQLVA